MAAGSVHGTAADGSTFIARLPFDQVYDGAPVPADLAAASGAPARWGLLLVRKGGFAVALLESDQMTQSKVGQRHVQGRTKAGGQSQQRFSRRRDNQARQAYEAAADHAVRILGEAALPVIAGGDRPAVDEVLSDPRLRRVRVVGPWLPVPDPRRAVLRAAAEDARALRVTVRNATS